MSASAPLNPDLDSTSIIRLPTCMKILTAKIVTVAV